MKRTPLLITAGIVLVIAGGFFAYEFFGARKPLSLWDIVPPDAIAVYEKQNCQACIEEVDKSGLWKIVESISGYNRPKDSISGKITKLLHETTGAIVSVHVTKKDDFDFIFYLPQGERVKTALAGSLAGLKTREFGSVNIEEVKIKNYIFSYAIIEGIWVGSFTPFLVEDVIRTYNRDTPSQFRRGMENLAVFTVGDDAGNLYIQLKNLAEWLSVFSEHANPLGYVLGKSAVLDIKTDTRSVTLNGFSVDSAGPSRQMLSMFNRQSPVSFGLKNLVSNRIIAVSHFGISDGKLFSEDLEVYRTKHRRPLADTLKRLSQTVHRDLAKLNASIADEFSVCVLEAARGRGSARVLLIEVEHINEWLTTFEAIAENLSTDTIFYERYSEFMIRQVPIHRFPEKLLWPLVTGFDLSFYTAIGKVILISDSPEDLKRYLDDIQADETWGRSVAQNRFLESTLLESNVSLYVDVARSWTMLAPKLQPKWQRFVREHQAMLQSIKMSSFQFSHLNNNFYTNAHFTYSSISEKNVVATSPTFVTNFPRKLTAIHAVRSHVNRSTEILLQDSANYLSLVSADGSLLWEIPLPDRIIGEVRQLDFFNNGKLQYLFATKNSLHIVDRLGNNVDPYPILLPVKTIEHLSVIDYDNSKKYRILVAEPDGKLWMFDKAGNNLEGWTPLDISSGLLLPPRHHRIKGRDFITAVRRDGKVYLLNRRGEVLKNFPFHSESLVIGDYFLEIGKSIPDSYFVLVTRDGYRIRFNAEGEIQGRETLLKTGVASVFGLVRENSNKSYLILQRDGKNLTLADESGKRLISNTLTGVSPSDVQYLDFGAGNVFITISDKVQHYTYVYDGQGNLLTTPPLETTAVEIRPQNRDEFLLFFIHGKSLTIQSL